MSIARTSLTSFAHTVYCCDDHCDVGLGAAEATEYRYADDG